MTHSTKLQGHGEKNRTMTNNNSQNGSTSLTTRGFAMPVIIAIIVLVVAAAGVGYFVTRSEPQTDLTRSTSSWPSATQTLAGENTLEGAAMVKPEGVAMEGKEESAMVKPEGVMVKPEGAMMAKAGSYEAYSPEKIALASAKGNVVLNFFAAWCPLCRTLKADIQANLANIPSNLTILTVDYDNSTDIKKKYGVTYQHTMVQVDKDGNLIKKWMGSPTLAAFVAEVK